MTGDTNRLRKPLKRAEAAEAALAASEAKVAKLRNMVGALADRLWGISHYAQTTGLIQNARDVLAETGESNRIEVGFDTEQTR